MKNTEGGATATKKTRSRKTSSAKNTKKPAAKKATKKGSAPKKPAAKKPAAKKSQNKEEAQVTVLRLSRRPQGVTIDEVAEERGSSVAGSFQRSINVLQENGCIEPHKSRENAYVFANEPQRALPLSGKTKRPTVPAAVAAELALARKTLGDERILAIVAAQSGGNIFDVVARGYGEAQLAELLTAELANGYQASQATNS